MLHPHCTFDLTILRPIIGRGDVRVGYLVRIKGFRLVHAVMGTEDFASVEVFRAYLLGLGSFHVFMTRHELEGFIALCVRACEIQRGVTLELALEQAAILNSATDE